MDEKEKKQETDYQNLNNALILLADFVRFKNKTQAKLRPNMNMILNHVLNDTNIERLKRNLVVYGIALAKDKTSDTWHIMIIGD
jgi:hypothetical protein